MHMNQVAIAYSSDEERDLIKASLGLTNAEWIKDTVRSEVIVLGRHGEYVAGENVADLEFCMAMGGTQFELIRYRSGPNWISEASRLGVRFPMVGHIGFHLDEGEAWPPAEAGGVLVQEALTVEHSNSEVNAAQRRYHYRIYRIGPSAYLKFIKRLTVGAAQDPSLATMTDDGTVLQPLPEAQPLFQQTERTDPVFTLPSDAVLDSPTLTGALTPTPEARAASFANVVVNGSGDTVADVVEQAKPQPEAPAEPAKADKPAPVEQAPEAPADAPAPAAAEPAAD